MEMSSYERYGLHGNPFQLEDKGTSLQALEIYHVTQLVDDELALIKEGVFNRENKAAVMLVGTPGIGKTHRLLLANREADLNNMFCVFYDIGTGSRIAAEGLVQAFLSKKQKRFGQPSWMKSLQKFGKGLSRGYDPGLIGGLVAEALNAQAPAFLLINGFHTLPQVGDADRFLAMLSVVIDRLRAGVLIFMECDSKFFSGLLQSNQGFASRVKRRVTIPPLTNDEARLLLAKRLLVKRMVEDVDPLYPFTQESVNILNARANGIPHALLEQAKFVFDDATKRRIITIDDGYVTELFRLKGEAGIIDEVLSEDQPDLEVVDEAERPRSTIPKKTFTPVKPTDSIKTLQNPTQKRGRKPKTTNPLSAPIAPPSVTSPMKPSQQMKPGRTGDGVDAESPLGYPEYSSSVKEIDNEPFEPPEEPEDSDEHVSTKFSDDSSKPLHQSHESSDMEKPGEEKKVRRLIPNGLPKLRRNDKARNTASSVGSGASYQARMQCPKCFKIFTMTVSSSVKQIQCPHCQFRGTIKQ